MMMRGIEVREAAGGFILVRAADWSPGVRVRQPGISRGAGALHLRAALAGALAGGGALAADLRGLAAWLEAGTLPTSDGQVLDAIARGVEQRRVLVLRIAPLPGAREIRDDPIEALREARGEMALPGMMGGGMNVATMSFADRCVAVLQLVPHHITDERIKQEFLALISPEALALTAAALGVMATNPAGWLGLLVGGALLGVSLFLAGRDVLEHCARAAEAFEKVQEARSEADLDAAAAILAGAIVGLGVGLFMRIVARAGPKRRRGTSATPDQSQPRSRRAREPERAEAPREKTHQPRSRNGAKVRDDVPKDWLTPNGDPNWSKLPKDGFANGVSSPGTIKPGAVVDRYGHDGGSFLSPDGTPFEQRALPWDQASVPHKRYRVLRELPVQQGEIAPGFGHPGGGTQYKTSTSIANLLDPGQPGGPFLEVIP